MFPVIIETPRFRLREFTLDDASAMQAVVGDLEVVRYMPLGPTTPDDVGNYVRGLIQHAEARDRSAYSLAIVMQGEREVIGAVSLTIDSLVHRRAEIGYVLRRDCWGSGYATEVAGAVVDFAFDHLGMHRVWAVCDPENPSSGRVLEKVGMRQEGLLRDDLHVRGEWRDSRLFAVLADERVRQPVDQAPSTSRSNIG